MTKTGADTWTLTLTGVAGGELPVQVHPRQLDQRGGNQLLRLREQQDVRL